MLAKSIANLFRTDVNLYWRRFQTTFNVTNYEYHLLDAAKGVKLDCTISREEGLAWYTDMANIRRAEHSISHLYQAKMVRGFCHLCTGQEAIAVGIYNCLRPQDDVITSYRAHGYAYLMGGKNLEPLIAELIGAKTGFSKGKGGSVHIYTDRFYGGNGIVGAQIALGTGLAFAHQYKNDNGVTFTIYGDGAANQGQAYESYNMAKLWNLPVIYVVENNMYSMGTSVERSSANPNYFNTCVYIPGILIDGMDIFAVKNAVEFAIKFASEGNGPIILEMRTYRYFGHSMSDPGSTYRTRDEVAHTRKTRDPMLKLRQMLVGANLTTNEELNDIKKRIAEEQKPIVDKVKTHGPLGLEHVSADVLKKSLQDNIRGVTILKPFKHQNFPPKKC